MDTWERGPPARIRPGVGGIDSGTMTFVGIVRWNERVTALTPDGVIHTPAITLLCQLNNRPIPAAQRTIAAQPALAFSLPGKYNESVEKPYGKSAIFSG